jgi:hypothetical protein
MTHRWAVLLIAAVGLLFFGDLALRPTQTLYSDTSDLLAFHLPYKHFWVESYQATGAWPLWCPYIFGGMPFAHDIGASVYYPLHWPLLLVPLDWLGAAVSWLVVLHVIMAGWFMYAYAWHRGLRGTGALTAALGYMLAGKWMLHLLAGGHYNLIALAWLPLVVLWLEQAIEYRSLVRATWAGTAFALLIVCAYPYVTLYVGLFVAVWTLGLVLAPPPGLRKASVWIWAGMGAWAAVVAITLGAAQLLPGLEIAGEASRSAGVGLSLDYFVDGLRTLAGLAGPPVSDEPNMWENRTGLGLLWLALLVMAPLIVGRLLRYEIGVLAAMLVFSLGGAALFQWLPGFNLFRLPSRMLLVAALPVSLIAGWAVQTLSEGISLEVRLRCRTILVRITAIVLLAAGAFGLSLGAREDIGVRLHPYWLTLVVTIPLAYGLLSLPAPIRFRWLRGAWVVLLLVDAGMLSGPLVATRPEKDVYEPSACVNYLAERRGEHGRILDFAPPEFSPNHTPLWPGLAPVVRVEPLRGFNPIDVRRYKEYLQFIAGDDKPLQAIDGMFTGPLVGAFPIKNQALADLLGVRLLLQPADLPLEATVPDNHARRSWVKVKEDPAPTTFDIISVQAGGRDAGMQPLPAYVVYENTRALPRAFIVAEAAKLPERPAVLKALESTDFRRQVLLEGYAGESSNRVEDQQTLRSATIRTYNSNRIEIEADGGPAGYLVLADVWFPGWSCTVDGKSAEVYRANYLFRAVELPARAREVVFCFVPISVAWGERISVTAAACVVLVTLAGFAGNGRRTFQMADREPVSHAMPR